MSFSCTQHSWSAMHRTPGTARTAVYAQLGFSRMQNKYGNSQQSMLIPDRSLWALGKESSWEEADGARRSSAAWSKPHFFSPRFAWVEAASRMGWMKSLGWQQPTLGTSPAFRFPLSLGPPQKGFIRTGRDNLKLEAGFRRESQGE